jgi:hypothetical protein
MTAANAPDLWDRIWEREGADTWRSSALSQVYVRIERSIRPGVDVVDIGGGIGVLAERLAQHARIVEVWDHSQEALRQAEARGLTAYHLDLEEPEPLLPVPDHATYAVGTEILEHLTPAARAEVLGWAAKHCAAALWSVPHDRLGPDEEPQHTIQYTARAFLDELRSHWGERCRVECLGPYLLGVCGEPAEKPYRLSVTLPVRDEGADLARTLASFRGVADELVVGVDPRTVDDTRDVAARFADVVFELESPRGPPGEEVAHEDGVHFAHVRNQCIDRCTGDWIFMTEGHERLVCGDDVLLRLEQLPEAASVVYVIRQGAGQQWGFPWLWRRDPSIRFVRPVHNMLEFPRGAYVIQAPQIRTLHDRDHGNAVRRAVQRNAQNRLELLEDWKTREDVNSLFYLAGEWRPFNPAKAVDLMSEFLARSNNGVQRYQARLILAKEHAKARRFDEARDVLHPAGGEDWTRSEHLIWLGDLAALEDRWEEAHRWYTLASVSIGEPPFTVWFVDLDAYTYLPAQRLATACGELGRLEEGLGWARRVVELLPDDAPPAAFEEARKNVTLFEEATK